MTKLDSLKIDLNNAVNRLSEVLQLEKNAIVRDSAIKRFEIAFDLSWKFLKTYLEDIHGIIVASPKNTFREAHKLGIIEYDSIWLSMTDDRNQIAHIYKEALAEDIFARLPLFLNQFNKLLTIY